ncbi:methyl-accepting chemotaxis protein [Gracilibacillus sp. S3-1-1]|uniref:Methyl-accepting chemotaxis protein n=1 Tax=Gracilibacillus pellucidus TaxID=3095368 RepID=A0ACC6M996_9BACI|nr:methyl-accepting chemotaxis protein [Gracilibacillus sp. S3-1-1]MDX8047448.1 methyl-accepting chemotaxis protein [Gracilibacillus sp. S3-1-1]
MKKRQSISVKLMALIAIMISVTGIVIGVVSYQLAKAELLESGSGELQKITDGAYTVLELLQEDVDAGYMTENAAKEKARKLLNGPTNENNEYDYTQTNFVYKDNGYVLAYDPELVLQLHPSKIGGEPADDLNRNNRQRMIDAGAKEQKENRFVTYNDRQPDGSFKDKIAYMRHFEPWDWTIGVAVFEDEFYQELYVLRNVIVSITVAIIVLSSVVFYLLSRKKLKLLRDVTHQAINISNGDFAESKLAESKDEMGVLAGSFNTMTTELRKLVTNVKGSSEQLLDAATDLSAISEETSASSEEIGDAMNEISKGTQEQSSDLEDVHYRVENLTQAIVQMKNQADKVDNISADTEQLSYQGIEIVTKLQGSNKKAVERANAISEDIRLLQQNVQGITAVMDTIEHIAEETNLLALNASIEAARAGEYGKGFAVVAEEIRKLAEQSKDATHEVQTVVSKIVSETDKTVVAVEENHKTSEGLNNDVRETGETFADMQKAIKDIVSAISVVKSEIDGITTEAEKMSENVESISSVSEEAAGSVEEITASLDEQINAIGNVATSAEKLTRLNQDLSNLVEKYKLS